MSRNGSGIYSKVNTFVSGTQITASAHNANWDDLVTEMTNSVAADGQTSMTGPLKHASGTAGLPSLTFAADADTGIYRSNSNEISVALGGSQAIVLTSSGIEVIGTNGVTDAAGAILSALIGEAKIWLLPTAPTGWMYVYGQACTTDFPLWRAALVAGSNPFGTSGGDPLFPDLRGRLLAGRDDMGLTPASRITSGGSGINGTTLGANGGAETVSIAQANIPNYNLSSGSLSWSQTGGGLVSGTAVNTVNTTTTQFNTGQNTVSSITTLSPSVTVSGSIGGTVPSGGSGTALNKMPPAFIVNFIVRAA